MEVSLHGVLDRTNNERAERMSAIVILTTYKMLKVKLCNKCWKLFIRTINFSLSMVLKQNITILSNLYKKITKSQPTTPVYFVV